MSIFTVLCGGSLLTSCDTRIKRAVVGGLEDAIYSLLDPSKYIQDDL